MGIDRQEVGILTFEEIKEEIKNKLQFWNGKGISLKGGIRVLNMYVTSKLWNVCEVSDIPTNIKTEINRLLSDFIWQGNYHQRSLDGLQRNYNSGGSRLACIDTKIQTSRVRWLSHLVNADKNKIECFLANSLISDNKVKIGLHVLKTWYKLKVLFRPKNPISIKMLVSMKIY